MSTLNRWWAGFAAALTGATLSLTVPALAWAASNPTVLAVGDELIKRRKPRIGGFIGFAGLLCCLLVVGVIGLIVFLIMRKKRSRG